MTDLKDKAAEQFGEMKEAGKKARASAALRSTGFWIAAAAGEEYFASSIADDGTVLWLLERHKKMLFDAPESMGD